MKCDVCTRVDGQNDPSPRSTSPLDGELTSHQAAKSPISTDQQSSAGILLSIMCSAGTHCVVFSQYTLLCYVFNRYTLLCIVCSAGTRCVVFSWYVLLCIVCIYSVAEQQNSGRGRLLLSVPCSQCSISIHIKKTSFTAACNILHHLCTCRCRLDFCCISC